MGKLTFDKSDTPIAKLLLEDDNGQRIELRNGQPFSSPQLFAQSAPFTVIPWNNNSLPASLGEYESGKYTFRPAATSMDWLITDGDFQARGTNQNMSDSSTEVEMKYWGYIHGESVIVNPHPTPFPPPEENKGGTVLSIKVTASIDWESRQALVTWAITKYEDGTPLTGFDLFINGVKREYTQVGNTAQVYIDYNTSNDWFILTSNRQARGSFNMVESNINVNATAKLDKCVELEGSLQKVSSIGRVSWDGIGENIIELSITNIDRNVPRYGYSVRAWKALSGIDGTTPEFALGQVVITRPPVYGAVGITIDEDKGSYGDTFIWEIVNGPWYASGSVVLSNVPQVINVQVAKVYGEMTDPRDGKVYGTIIMPDGKLWSARNLDYTMLGTGDYYGNTIQEKEANGAIFGRLYTSDEALNGQSYVNLNPSARQGIAPVGWHIPSDSEWIQLMRAITKDDGVNADKSTFGNNLNSKHGLYLKSSNMWDGEGRFGFNALPGGRQENGIFDGLNVMTEFVSSSDYNSTTQISRIMKSLENNVSRDQEVIKTSRRMYVRFIKDRVN